MTRYFSHEGRYPIKDPGSALTHLFGFAAAIFLTPVLLIHAAARGASPTDLTGLSMFMLGMVLLYGASTAYHTFDISEKVNKILKKADHMMIFVLIAGSYTPICLTALPHSVGSWLLMLVWILAGVGITVKALWVTCPKWFSSVVYIAMGWVCVLAFPQLLECLPSGAFGWLLAGGILYTVGGVLYALKLGRFNRRFRNFGSHEIFHLFVLGGTACHFIVMFCYLPV